MAPSVRFRRLLHPVPRGYRRLTGHKRRATASLRWPSVQCLAAEKSFDPLSDVIWSSSGLAFETHFDERRVVPLRP